MPNKGVSWSRCMWVRSDGQSVADFCREHNVAYNLVHKWIEKLGNVDEACEKALERKGHKDNNTRHWIEGKSLRQYCKENGLKYWKMYYEIRKREELKQDE